MPGLTSYGRYRIVPTVVKGKVAFKVVAGNIVLSTHRSRGEAASTAIKLDRAERKTKEAVEAAKKTGIKAAKFGAKAGRIGFALFDLVTSDSKKESTAAKKKLRSGLGIKPKPVKTKKKKKSKKR